MVTAPKCKICGSVHFGSAHVWSTPTVAREPVKPSPAKPVPRSKPATVDVDAMIGAVMDQVTAGASTFDRTAYQREYMRKRRAKP